ncbi:MAG TPA: hypothetical protein DEF51_29895, partial [Myxococcales bacterium]|nr:hypothetical protein [Myxococcales bacterium]
MIFVDEAERAQVGRLAAGGLVARAFAHGDAAGGGRLSDRASRVLPPLVVDEVPGRLHGRERVQRAEQL